MAGLDPAIQTPKRGLWMPGSRPGMTQESFTRGLCIKSQHRSGMCRLVSKEVVVAIKKRVAGGHLTHRAPPPEEFPTPKLSRSLPARGREPFRQDFPNPPNAPPRD